MFKHGQCVKWNWHKFYPSYDDVTTYGYFINYQNNNNFTSYVVECVGDNGQWPRYIPSSIIHPVDEDEEALMLLAKLGE